MQYSLLQSFRENVCAETSTSMHTVYELSGDWT